MMIPEIPDYVCCVVTEAVWTIFGSTLLSVVLFILASLKYFRKYLSKSKFTQKNLRLLDRHVTEDGKSAIAIIRRVPVLSGQFIKYCALRRKKTHIDEMEFAKVLKAAERSTTSPWSDPPHQSAASADVATATATPTPTTDAALAPENLDKNHNPVSVPYDFNAVRLEPDGRYVNASRIVPGEEGNFERVWIVTQGPRQNTMEDFWALVWQEQCRLVIMLTRKFECVKAMCTQYWPELVGTSLEYGPYSVKLCRRDLFANYQVSQLRLKRLNSDEERHVKHFQLLNWPAYDQPDPTGFRVFHREVMNELEVVEKQVDGHTPIVHCHDGGGRSGAFLTIQANLNFLKRSGTLDVFGTVRWLRSQRRSLVSTPGQYRFIYDVMEDNVSCGDTSVKASEYAEHLASLRCLAASRPASSSSNGAKGANRAARDGFQAEFEKLGSLRPTFGIGDCAAGHRSENRSKNRNPMVVPPDEQRPYLTSPREMLKDGDYINAVFVDSFRASQGLIATEWPMPETWPSFWTMVYDHQVSTIVLLYPSRSVATRELTNYGRFWPVSPQRLHKAGKMFSLEMVNHELEPDLFEAWDIAVQKIPQLGQPKEPIRLADCIMNNRKRQPVKTVRLFESRIWPADSALPTSIEAFLNLMDRVSQWRRSRRGSGGVEPSRGSKGAANHHHHRVLLRRGGPSSDGADEEEDEEEDKVVVVSQDGFSRIGVFCIVTRCKQQLESMGTVDLYMSTKLVRKPRPQLIPTCTEYRYCHQVVERIIEQSQDCEDSNQQVQKVI